MRFAKAAQRATTGGQPWPRVVGALALAVLGAGAVIVLVIPPRGHASTSLESRSDWTLAGTLPAGNDFPADWGYGLYAYLRPVQVADNAAAAPWRPGVPRTRYAPAACTGIPKILDHSGAAMAAHMGVDRYTKLEAHSAAAMDDAATGEREDAGPDADLDIWIAPDGPTRIANYVDWLGRCGTYHVTNYDQSGDVRNERAIQTVVEARAADGSQVAVTRTVTGIGRRVPSATYHVVYYALRGVIVECTIHLDGPDRDLVQRRTAQTLQRLHAL